MFAGCGSARNFVSHEDDVWDCAIVVAVASVSANTESRYLISPRMADLKVCTTTAVLQAFRTTPAVVVQAFRPAVI
jgi:hypothetical protein